MPKKSADNSPLLERALYAYDGLEWQAVKVDSSGLLSVSINSRIPSNATDLTSRTIAVTLAVNSLVELFSGSTSTTFTGLSGRTVASNKTLVISQFAALTQGGGTGIEVIIGYDSTALYQVALNDFGVQTNFNPFLRLSGNGSKVYKVAAINKNAGAANTIISAICWEETV